MNSTNTEYSKCDAAKPAFRLALILAALALNGCPSRDPTQPPNLFQDNCEQWICDQAGDCWCDSRNESGEES